MSTIKKHTTTIDGLAYTTTTLTASDGLRIMPKLVALFGDAIMGLLFSTDEEQRGEIFSDPKIVASIITAVASNAAETDGLLVVRELLARTECESVAIGDAQVPGNVATHFDLHFAGRYKHLVEVALWVGRVNFLDP